MWLSEFSYLMQDLYRKIEKYQPISDYVAKAVMEIYELIEELAAQSMAILFVSSELEEVIGIADRVYVMHEGAITGELKREHLNEESIMKLATATNGETDS